MTWYSRKMMISYNCIRGFKPNAQKNLEWYLVLLYLKASPTAPFARREWRSGDYPIVPINWDRSCSHGLVSCVQADGRNAEPGL